MQSRFQSDLEGIVCAVRGPQIVILNTIFHLSPRALAFSQDEYPWTHPPDASARADLPLSGAEDSGETAKECQVDSEDGSPHG